MANLERDKFLTEAMGDKWLTKADENPNWPPQFQARNNNFSTWSGFGKLWEWASKQDWWGEFVKKHGKLDCNCGCNDGSIALHFIKPKGPYNFPDEIYEFLMKRRST